MGKFKQQVANFAEMAEEQALAVARQAIQDMTIQMQVSVEDGGKMPVDTGFLRWSGAGTLNNVPVGEVKGRSRRSDEPKDEPLPEYKQPQSDFLQNILAQMKAGDTFYWGWTAEYAQIQESEHRFMDSEVEKWQKYVDNTVRRLKHG